MRGATRQHDGSRAGAVSAAALGTLALIGCAKFADPSTVVDLRVLAINAEPSEVILNIADPADLATVAIPEITLSPLVVDPEGGGRQVLLTVSACANDPSALSPPNNGADPTGFPSGGARTTVGSTLCDGDATTVAIASDVDIGGNPSVVARFDPGWIMDAFKRDVFRGPDGQVHGGFDLGMPVVFQITVQAGSDTVKAIKRVTFWARPVRGDQRPNQTPQVSDISVYDRRDETTADPIPGAVQPLPPGGTASVPTTGLWIDPAPAEAEPYVTAVLDRLTGQPIPHDVARETLHYTFYATAGKFSPFDTSSEPAPGVTVKNRIHIESKYQPRPTGGPAAVTIWIVVRDERGGTSWQTRIFNVPATSASENTGP